MTLILTGIEILIIGQSGTNTIQLLINTSTFNSISFSQYQGTLLDTYSDFTVDDIDNDGRPDIVVSHSNIPAIGIYTVQSDKTIQLKKQFCVGYVPPVKYSLRILILMG